MRRPSLWMTGVRLLGLGNFNHRISVIFCVDVLNRINCSVQIIDAFRRRSAWHYWS